MTCPKCGYVSYPGLPQCRKCGYRFVTSEPKEPSPETPESPEPVSTNNQAAPHEDTLPIITSVPDLDSPVAEGSPSEEIPVIQSDPLPVPEPPSPMWRDELAGKLEDHRRKRSRLRGNFDPSSSLDFQFGNQATGTSPQAVDADLSVPSRGAGALDAQLDAPRRESSPLEGLPLEKPVEGIRVLTSAAVQAGESHLEDDDTEQPVGIILEPPPASGLHSAAQPAAGSLRVAPLSTRFAAGLVDAFILLMGGALFALIFFIVGGRASLGPLNLAVFGCIATLFILAYFGAFCALNSSTPGLLMLNLEFRSLAGGPPTPAESFWRAFGYLISGASLMLGFAWALVDSDHLTWHDHMSGTYITTIER